MSGSSRWGSFLQQAVAGVESRLDNILGEVEDAPSAASTPAITPISPKASENGMSL